MAAKQTSLEMFTKRKADTEAEPESDADSKRQKIKVQNQGEDGGEETEETEEMVDQMIMDLATDDRTQKEIDRANKRAQKEAEKAAKQAQKEAERAAKEAAKEAERAAKEAAKEAERAAKQAAKEAEKAAREAEKAARQAQREAEKAAKQAKQDARLLEKQARERERELAKLAEEEKLRKRSITNFFKVKTEDEPTLTSAATAREPPKTDFNNYFLPFHTGPHVTLHNTTLQISSKWDNIEEQIYIPNTQIKQSSTDQPTSRSSDVLQCLNIGSISEANAKFHNVPLKYLKFYENKKPAYFGTFSYTYTDVIGSNNILTNQCDKIRLPTDTPVIDYDYYSDIDEDDEDGEGEDIDSNDDDSDESDDDEDASSDIDAFLDENEAAKSTAAAKVMGPLVAVIRHCQQNDTDEFSTYFRSLQWEHPADVPTAPIDPFHNYWGDRPDTRSKVSTSTSITTTTSTSTPTPNLGTQATLSTGASNSSPVAMTVKRRTIPEGPTRAALRTFITENAHLSLPTLCEVAVKGGAGGIFKEWSKAVVKNTVREEAVWSKKSGWVLREDEADVNTTVDNTDNVDSNNASNSGNVSIADMISANIIGAVTPAIQ